MRIAAMAALILTAASVAASPVYSQEESQYKKFKMDHETTDAAIIYRDLPEGLEVSVSAVTTGKGSEFRRWEVTDIRLRIGGEAIRPGSYGRFYVTKESLFRYPAAVLFAVIGATVNASGSKLSKGVTRTGAAIALGLLATQAKGEITGMNASFKLSKELADKITESAAVEITTENKGNHWKDVIRTGLSRPGTASAAQRADYSSMLAPQIMDRLDSMKSEVNELEARQASYKYGEDPEYDDIQQKIESLETERAFAYRAWYERENKDKL